MNIAMVVYSHYSRDARVRRYAGALARRGFKVDVICLKEDYEPKEDISLIQYPLPRKRFGRFWYILEYILFFIYTTILLTINYYQKKYKVIHIHNMPDILVFTALVPKILGAKIVLDMHDPMPELYMSKYKVDDSSPGVRLLILLERLSFNFADHIITANPEFKKIFLSRQNIPSKKISAILNCPDERIFHPKNKRVGKGKFFTLLYMGTVDERFGLDIAIEAIPLIVKKIPNFKFIIIPKLEEEGKYFKVLRNKIVKNQLSSYVSIESPLPLENVAKKIEEANVGIVLAKNGVFTDNIFPVKLLEFVQMGVPVIATKTKILNRYFDKDSLYFLSKNTPAEFVQAVLSLWQNKTLRENFAKNAKNYLRKHNWPKEKERYLELIEFLH